MPNRSADQHGKPRRISPLALEITLALIFKAALLFGLWYAFFQHPVDRTLTAQDVGQRVLGADTAVKD
ncbi:MAG: hypothetical protein KGJ12_05595 [Gammaproteobacteria bacterium]|nr:hypothetical protein [Gammaproteobacteria bacterium]